MDYKVLVNRWKKTLNKVNSINGITHFHIEPVAKMDEVEKIERKIGISLPNDFQKALLLLSKEVKVYWELPDDFVVPKQFFELFSGQITWGINSIQFSKDYDKGYARLIFHHTPNGDHLFLSLDSTDKFGAVLYWNDEEEEEIFLAENFSAFLEEITNLHLVGTEIWKMENFIDQHGLNSNNLVATEWKEWFNQLDKRKSTSPGSIDRMEEIISKIVQNGRLKREEIQLLSNFDADELLKSLFNKLDNPKIINKSGLYFILGEVFHEGLEKWVLSLWNKDKDKLPPEMRSYLTAKCIPKKQGLPLVLDYVKEQGLDGIDSSQNLKYFRSNSIIKWMKEEAKLPYEGWNYLFAFSNPSWEDIVEWFELEYKHKVIAINSLGAMLFLNAASNLEERLGYEDLPIKIKNLPRKEEVISFLQDFKATGKVKMRHYMIEDFIENIDSFY